MRTCRPTPLFIHIVYTKAIKMYECQENSFLWENCVWNGSQHLDMNCLPRSVLIYLNFCDIFQKVAVRSCFLRYFIIEFWWHIWSNVSPSAVILSAILEEPLIMFSLSLYNCKFSFILPSLTQEFLSSLLTT